MVVSLSILHSGKALVLPRPTSKLDRVCLNILPALRKQVPHCLQKVTLLQASLPLQLPGAAITERNGSCEVLWQSHHMHVHLKPGKAS